MSDPIEDGKPEAGSAHMRDLFLSVCRQPTLHADGVAELEAFLRGLWVGGAPGPGPWRFFALRCSLRLAPAGAPPSPRLAPLLDPALAPGIAMHALGKVLADELLAIEAERKTALRARHKRPSKVDGKPVSSWAAVLAAHESGNTLPWTVLYAADGDREGALRRAWTNEPNVKLVANTVYALFGNVPGGFAYACMSGDYDHVPVHRPPRNRMERRPVLCMTCATIVRAEVPMPTWDELAALPQGTLLHCLGKRRRR